MRRLSITNIWFSCAFINLIFEISFIDASNGDKSYKFQRCARGCRERNCSISDDNYAAQQPWILQVTQWSCADECDYNCMWETVDAFKKDKQPNVPQFYGKWPFIRVFGMQEPASVIFSFLNGLTVFIMLVWFRHKVPSSAPLYKLWHFYALVAMNAWFWSVVFHSRDFPFTEKMDYFCAMGFVLTSLFVFCVRFCGTRRWTLILAIAVAEIAFFYNHVYYLSFVKFDYGYNMTATVSAGVLNGFGWICWSYSVRKTQPYVWKCVVTLVYLNLLITLELWDFSPILWTFDAHAIWHAGTVPIPFLWYSFAADDCLYMLKAQGSTNLRKEMSHAKEKKK